MSDPEYVKLAESRQGGLLADPVSKWSISGANVLPFPTAVAEVKFVRRSLALEQLESATEGEYDIANPVYSFPVVIYQGNTQPTVVQSDTTAFWIDNSDAFNVVVKRYVEGVWVAESEGSVDLPSGIYVQSTSPASPSNGNFWIDTSGSPVAKLRDSGSWVTLEVPTSGVELPEGLYVQSTTPSSPTNGDFWVDTTGALVAKIRDAGSWVTLEIPSSDIPEGIYISDTEPSSPSDNELWINMSIPAVKFRTGGVWIDLAPVEELPSGLYVQSSAPSSPSDDDVWVDTTSGLVVKLRVSGSWEVLEVAGPADPATVTPYVFTPSATTYDSVVGALSPTMYYKGNHVSNVLQDSSGNGNHSSSSSGGTITFGQTPFTGKLDSGVALNSGAKINLPTLNTSGAFSAAGWFDLGASGGVGTDPDALVFLSKTLSGGGPAYPFALFCRLDHSLFFANASNAPMASMVLDLDQPHFYAFTSTGALASPMNAYGIASLYVDGVYIGSNFRQIQSSGDLTVGREAGNYFGAVDLVFSNLAFWSGTELDASQIADLYEAGLEYTP